MLPEFCYDKKISALTSFATYACNKMCIRDRLNPHAIPEMYILIFSDLHWKCVFKFGFFLSFYLIKSLKKQTDRKRICQKQYLYTVYMIITKFYYN